MAKLGEFHDLAVDLDGPIATVEIQRPPNNFFDVALVRAIGDAFHALDQEPDCRAIVLECTNLPPYRDAIREAAGLPVYDIRQLIRWHLDALF